MLCTHLIYGLVLWTQVVMYIFVCITDLAIIIITHFSETELIVPIYVGISLVQIQLGNLNVSTYCFRL